MDDKQISDNCKKVSKKCGTIRFSISWREISLSKIGNMKEKKKKKDLNSLIVFFYQIGRDNYLRDKFIEFIMLPVIIIIICPIW